MESERNLMTTTEAARYLGLNTFPSETFSGKGNIGNIEVTCINPEAQVQFHLGYEYDENDVHDVLLLCRTFNLEIPEQYKTHI